MAAFAFPSFLDTTRARWFREQCFEQRPVVLRGGRDRFTGLFDQHAARALITRTGSITVHYQRAGAPADFVVPAEHVDLLLALAMTISVQSLHKDVPAIAAYAEMVAREVGHQGAAGMVALLSSPGAGYDVHFDPHSVFALQLEGAKRWRWASSPVKFANPPRPGSFVLPELGPVDYFGEELPRPDLDMFEEAVLEPGDAFYMPAGVWHVVRTESPSLSLTLELPAGGTGPPFGIHAITHRHV